MRLVLLAAIAAAALAIPTAGPASGQARLPSYCSKSGDLCYGVFRKAGVVSFRLTLAAKYFSRYRLCVRKVGKARVCKRFRVRKTGAQWGGTVKFAKSFPHTHGTYRVSWWRVATNRLGPPLTFTA
jgi:hypothetical protein